MFIRYHLWWIKMYNVREQFNTPVGTGKRQLRDSNLSLMTALAAASEWHMSDMTHYSSSLKQFTRRGGWSSPLRAGRHQQNQPQQRHHGWRRAAGDGYRDTAARVPGVRWLARHARLSHSVTASPAGRVGTDNWDPLRCQDAQLRDDWRHSTVQERYSRSLQYRLRSVTDVQDNFQKLGLSWRYTIKQYLQGSLLKNFIAL